MKFLLSVPGHTRTIPMSGFTEKALKQLGHEVVVFNHERNDFSERMREKVNFKAFQEYKNKQTLQLIEETKPDVFFTIYGKNHDAATIEKIKRMGIKTICWWLNDPFDLGYKHIPVQLYDNLLTNSRGTHAVYHHYNAKNVAYLPVGVDPEVHRPMPEVEKKYDIVFAGDWHPIREKVLTQLVQAGHNISIIGPWKRKLGKESPLWPYFIRQGYFTPNEMAELFNQARIVYNLHTWYGRWSYGVNPRLFEASGCGAFQIADNKEEIKELYEKDKEIILYEDVSEVSALLKHYLADERRRKEIGEQAYQRTLRSHTYVHRMQELIDICKLG
jgi:spore maturation protein CgeB